MPKIHELNGPILLLAGPGTGKTFTLALRLKYLIDEMSVDPNEITVITFTSDAAKNMRARISNPDSDEVYLPYTKQPSNIITMHSLGFKIIRSHPEKIGLQENTKLIPGDLEKHILLGDAAQISGEDRITGEDTAICRQLGHCEPEESPKCKVCSTYKSILRKCSSVDYDEQILLAVEILRDNPDIHADVLHNTKHLLVDEYQDINWAQHQLIQLLCSGNEKGLFVVGDDDQSIYSWRGGSPAFIRDFRGDYGKEANVIPLNKSWRCHPNILEGSLNVVAKHDVDRLPKEKFEYHINEGPTIKVHNAPSDKKEAKIVRAIVQSALPSQDVLILVPQRQFADAISAELRLHQIGFSTRTPIPGVGLPLLSRLKDWVDNPLDSVALRRCIESYLDRIGSPVPTKRVRKADKKQERQEAFLLIANLWNMVLEGKSDSLWTSLNAQKDDKEIYSSLYDSLTLLLNQYSGKHDITEFITNISKSLSPWRNISPFLDEVVSWVDAIRQVSFEGSDSPVRIMTFQGAKGLEAQVVCVLGLEEGVIPRTEDDVPEQSRLLFVTMTRAINELHLFHARVRSSNLLFRNAFAGGRPDVKMSRFIEDIPPKNKESIYHRA